MFQGMEYVYEVYKERSFSKAAANLLFPAIFKCQCKTDREKNWLSNL